MYETPRLSLKLVKEQTGGLEIPQFKNSLAVREFMIKLLSDSHCEHFYSLFLDNQNRFIGYYSMAGSVMQAPVYPREIFTRALLCNAVSIILVHNHPGGLLQPSPEDQSITRKIVLGGETLDVKVIDHIIVSDEGYYSFNEHGLI